MIKIKKIVDYLYFSLYNNIMNTEELLQLEEMLQLLYEELKLTIGNATQYTLTTGQGSQQVKKRTTAEIRADINDIKNQIHSIKNGGRLNIIYGRKRK